MHPVLEQLSADAQWILANQEKIAAARRDACGLGVDHAETPSVLAVVKENRLVGLQIDDSLLDEYRSKPAEFSVYLNAVITRAFQDWRDDFNGKAK
ncbi:hypothetical protein EEB14_33355 [Rhodococcus sp. WS4]|nr:hypothetical protein EEB14_33355 [Rhodococcus sp. WS4]